MIFNPSQIQLVVWGWNVYDLVYLPLDPMNDQPTDREQLVELVELVKRARLLIWEHLLITSIE